MIISQKVQDRTKRFWAAFDKLVASGMPVERIGPALGYTPQAMQKTVDTRRNVSGWRALMMQQLVRGNITPEAAAMLVREQRREKNAKQAQIDKRDRRLELSRVMPAAIDEYVAKQGKTAAQLERTPEDGNGQTAHQQRVVVEPNHAWADLFIAARMLRESIDEVVGLYPPAFVPPMLQKWHDCASEIVTLGEGKS